MSRRSSASTRWPTHDIAKLIVKVAAPRTTNSPTMASGSAHSIQSWTSRSAVSSM
jgi:hypothetical protein